MKVLTVVMFCLYGLISQEVDIKWIGLFVVACIGMFSIYIQVKQLAELRVVQDELAMHQHILEKELGVVGDKYVS